MIPWVCESGSRQYDAVRIRQGGSTNRCLAEAEPRPAYRLFTPQTGLQKHISTSIHSIQSPGKNEKLT